MVPVVSICSRDADRVARELARGRGRIPALHDDGARASARLVGEEAEPVPLDHVAAERHRRLLVLGREVWRAHLGFEPFEDVERLALGMQDVADGSAMDACRPMGTICSTSAMAGSDSTSQPSCCRR